jgi:ubiquinone/menaquinone biosynthesis C-methylase UbiE
VARPGDPRCRRAIRQRRPRGWIRIAAFIRIAAASPFAVEFVGLSAENILVADTSFDSIVTTFTLCTIPDVGNALREMHRALNSD